MKAAARTNEAAGLEWPQEWSSSTVRPYVFIKLISKPVRSYSTSRHHKNRDYSNFPSALVVFAHQRLIFGTFTV